MTDIPPACPTCSDVGFVDDLAGETGTANCYDCNPLPEHKDAVYIEIDSILTPTKAANPGISNGEIAEHLPEHLRQPFWARAVENYLTTALAGMPPTDVTTVATILDSPDAN
ncbi:hypothetical protein FHR83_006814 [Actinoplanes campanulatus]|uniref:Uncharacterized protein n=1 Tax=Actinoplanes campanulatus TaxID=113559 RepID=A0A7W5AMN8_9ACTN|nr:hypothetical protein [Actinoplanes campanulatus]MBB3099108.1 hypothetical protein [Actinoplanes campanulatus]GGN39006.1 hypothetical protein GCM10010109_66450 [Actinoplanes campanulatus]GID40264.1 hypothetical protein Aca09nite_67700 [Actinoplanes campanulatus]